jgi:2-desacetyl-2-hydroxyethyl bacteriochlorophyllide A dehydrogenase
MRAAILEAAQRLIVRDVPAPVPAPDDVLIAVELAGVCGSDVSLYLGHRPGPYPFIMGHEAIGRVVAAGGSSLEPGTRVVIEPNFPCGVCDVCRRGSGNACPAKRSLGVNMPGAFADVVVVPAHFVHAVPDEIAPLDAVGLEPLAVAIHALGVGQVASGDAIVVIGCGSEGLLLTQAAAALGARVLAVDVRPGQLSVAERVGAVQTLAVQPGEDLERLGVQIAREWAPSVVFECAGAAPAATLALHAAPNGGTIVLIGLADTAISLVPLTFVRRGLRLLSSVIYDHPADFTRAIELVQTGRVQPGALVTHTLGLDEAPRGLQLVADGQTGKLLLDIGGVANLAKGGIGDGIVPG